MPKENQPYIAYLVRLWKVSHNGRPIWRASLESPKTGVRKGFVDVSHLFAFLEAQMQETGNAGEIVELVNACNDEQRHA